MPEIIKEQLDLYSHQAQRWEQAQTDEAMQVRDFEDFIALGMFWFARINHLDEQTRLEELRAGAAPDAKIHEGIVGLYRAWLDTGRGVVRVLESFKANRWEIDGAEAFRSAVREVEGILTPDDKFFTGEKLARLIDQAREDYESGHTEPMDSMCD